MSQVIQTNAPIDFSDIADKNDNILDDPPSKEQIREAKRLEKEKAKEEKALARELAREAKKASKSQKNDIEVLDDETSKEVQQTRATIARYRGSKKFSKFLKESGFKLDDKTLSKLGRSDLEELLERVQFAVSNKNSEGMFKSGIMTGLQGFEYIASNNNIYPLQVQGLTATLNAQESFHEVIEEIMLENQMMVYTKPTWRLMYMVASTAMTLHNTNNAFAKLPPEQQKVILRMGEEAKEKAEAQAKSGTLSEKAKDVSPPEPVRIEPKDFGEKLAELKKEFSDLVQ